MKCFKKKMLALCLTAVMILGVSSTIFAEENYDSLKTVTIEGAKCSSEFVREPTYQLSINNVIESYPSLTTVFRESMVYANETEKRTYGDDWSFVEGELNGVLVVKSPADVVVTVSGGNYFYGYKLIKDGKKYYRDFDKRLAPSKVNAAPDDDGPTIYKTDTIMTLTEEGEYYIVYSSVNFDMAVEVFIRVVSDEANAQLDIPKGSNVNDITIPTQETENIVSESFYIQPGEKYSFTNTGEGEAGILMGSDKVSVYNIQFYTENGVLKDEREFSMDGYGGPGILPKEMIIVSVEKSSPNPLKIVDYNVNVKVEKIESALQEKEHTSNQSTLRFTGFYQLDIGNSINYEIKNNTDYIDTSRYAVIAYADGMHIEVHILDEVQLNPNETYTGSFVSGYNTPTFLDDATSIIIVKFDDTSDKAGFEKSVPFDYERAKTLHIPGYVELSDKSQKWLKDNFNIDWKWEE